MTRVRFGLIPAVFAVMAACGGEPVEPPPPPELSAFAPIGKLPGDARPLSYDLKMAVDPREETFTGNVEIVVELDDDTSGFWMHGDDLRVEQVEVWSENSPDQKTMATWDEVLESGVARIGFAQNFGPGIIHVRVQYEADFDKNLAGLFRVEEQGEAYALAKSESIQARRFLPSFDQPAFKAPFDITLTIPAHMAAISNAPVVDERVVDGGPKSVRFATTRPLPTYLLSVAVGSFDIVDAGVLPANEVRREPIPLRGITRKGRGGDIARALDVTSRLVEIFETQLQQPYPYRKLDIIAAPAWPSGATELAGAITYRESRILLNDQSGPGAERDMLRIHTHEIGHMWFGNLVTPPWWDDLWLKEAFATWGTPVALSLFEPDGGHDLDAVSRGLSAMRLDSLASVRAVREPIERNEDIRNAYDSITYSKGMSVIGMMDGYFGADVFRPALGEYVAAFGDGIADSPAFFEVIGKVTEEPRLTEAFRSFVEQKGVPQIDVSNVSSEPDALQFRVRQSRYTPLGSGIKGQPIWTIPVCIRIQGRTAPACQMFDTRDAIIRVLDAQDASWVMPNASAQGYYRFNLPPDMWTALAADFRSLTTAEQLATVDSATAMFEAGVLDSQLLLMVFEAAANAENRRVITAPARALTRYVDMLEGEDRDKFQSYLSALYRAPLKKVRSQSGIDAQLLDSSITGFLAFSAEDPDHRADTVARAKAFLGIGADPDPRALTSDEFRDAFLLLVQDGTSDDYSVLSAEIETRDDPRFQMAASAALGGTRDRDLATAARRAVLDGQFGSREAYALIANQMSEPIVREDAWEWLQSNYVRFIEKIPAQWARRTPRLVSSFCDIERFAELETLFDQHGHLAPGHEASLLQTRERLELCSALQTSKIPDLVAAVHGVE